MYVWEKYVYSSENKELLIEFFVNYEDEALKYKNRGDLDIEDFSVEQVEMRTHRLITN